MLEVVKRVLGGGEDGPGEALCALTASPGGAALGHAEVRCQPRAEPRAGTRREPEETGEQHQPSDGEREREGRERRAPG